MASVWLFGYGSLIWRPDFEFVSRKVAWVDGWSRRFWQGSHDHRGVPDAPGRVVTLIPVPGERCGGMAFEIEEAMAAKIFDQLDYREKNGYERHRSRLLFGAEPDDEPVEGIFYVAVRVIRPFSGLPVQWILQIRLVCQWDQVELTASI